jgi:hypothetical protein
MVVALIRPERDIDEDAEGGATPMTTPTDAGRLVEATPRGTRLGRKWARFDCTPQR